MQCRGWFRYAFAVKKTAKVLAIIAIVLIGVVLVFVLEEHFRGERTLKRYLKQLEAKGEILDYAELVPPKPAPEQNAALVLSELTNDLHGFFELSRTAPLIKTFVAPGRAVAGWKQDSWEVDKKQSNSWTEFAKEIEPAMPTLARLENIWPKTKYDDGYDYAKGFLESNPQWMLISTKQTVALLSEAVGYDLRRNDLESAGKHLRSILAITKALGTQRLIISQLVDEACASYAWNATWIALQATDWKENQLAELQSAWETIGDFPLAMSRSCEIERGMTIHYFQQLRASRSTAFSQLVMWEPMAELFGGEPGGSPTHGALLRYIHLPVWQIAWAAQDEQRALIKWQPIVEGGRIAAAKSWSDTKNIFSGDDLSPSLFGLGISTSKKELGWYDRWRYLFSSEPFSVSGATILRPLEVETEKNMVVTALALKRYELKHGKPATALTDLVPEFLAAVPIDRMDGKPLRYHLNADGSFKLYSVGLNGTDEGGDPTPDKPLEHFGNIWQGKDAVWPVAVRAGRE